MRAFLAAEAAAATAAGPGSSAAVLSQLLVVAAQASASAGAPQGLRSANPDDPSSPEQRCVQLLLEASRHQNGATGHGAGAKGAGAGATLRRKAVEPSEAAMAEAQVTEHLLKGDRPGALSSAVRARLWPLAMVIAGVISQDCYKDVVGPCGTHTHTHTHTHEHRHDKL